MNRSDIIIIGAGPGGYETALLAASRGKSVTIIEAGHVGGICLNEGCIPTKSLCRSAEIVREIRESGTFGVKSGGCEVDFRAVMERKNAVVEQLRGGVETLLGHKLITLVHGRAAFKSSDTVVVGETGYTASDIIIATGSKAYVPPVPGADDPDVITSRELLGMDSLPGRLCIIGAGVIGLELASVMAAFGVQVTILEYCREILPRFDTDIAKRLKQSLVKSGMSIANQAMVQAIERGESGLEVKYDLKGRSESVFADKVLVAVGRRADTDAMNFSDIGIAMTPKGIEVDGNMQTSVPHIYAIGDVVGGYMLAHEAVAQGRKALDHICGIENDIDLSLMPSAVFTSPEAACVGLTEQQCKEQGIPYTCRKTFFRSNGKAVCMGQTDGICKIIVAAGAGHDGLPSGDADGKILGCHLMGPHASDLIQEITALMSCGATLHRLESIIHPHPTLSEVFL